MLTGGYTGRNGECVAGLMEGIGYSLAPQNSEIMITTLMTHFQLQPRAAAECGYASLFARTNRKPYASFTAMQRCGQLTALNDVKVRKVRIEDMIED